MARVSHDSIISSERLFFAADVILTALNSSRGRASVMSVLVGAVPVDGSPPPDRFMFDELIEAMILLIRMGFIVAEIPPLPKALSRGEAL